MKLILLAISIGLNVWLAATVVRLENIRYGAFLGMCNEQEMAALSNPTERLRYMDCLEQNRTRTGPLYHLAYALRIL
ncbi:hypothetical protein [Rhizobium mongolense]|uniref:hypothetical protein n=1 Tax=Rhizobium mongolense TaxID=57676 RepID=UPI0034A4D9A2